MTASTDRPRLRGVDLTPSRSHPGAIDLTDRSAIAASVITVSPATLKILARMDGRRTRAEIQASFMVETGRMLMSAELDALLRQLDKALFLEGSTFEAKWAALTREYQASPYRRLRAAGSLAPPGEKLEDHIDRIIAQSNAPASLGRKVVGLIAPHLDYARGGPCYAAAYSNLAGRTNAERFVILGTNHFGRGAGVVGTRKDFETPWGIVPHDGGFMARLDKRCGIDLCEHEFDHAREHSIELHVVLLRRLLGDRPFRIAAYLCPDPCGPTGTASRDGRGADLNKFALALREELNADSVPTCLIAGADLSHVGRYFQDDRNLDASNLAEIEASDRHALGLIEAGQPEAFRKHVAATSNDTNICSVGCIYALATALQGRAQSKLLRYHQAVISDLENCVTCAALEYPAN